MDPLGDPLKTSQIKTGWEFTIELYPSWWFGYVDNLDCRFGNCSVSTRTRTQCDSPEQLRILPSYVVKIGHPDSSVLRFWRKVLWWCIAFPQSGWCCEKVELEGSEPIITFHHTSCGSPNGIPEKEWFRLKERRKRVTRYDRTQLWGSTRTLGKGERDQKMRKIECVILCMIKRYEMIWAELRVYIPQGLPKTSSPLPSPSLLPLYICPPPSPSPSLPSQYHRTPTVAQSSAKLSVAAGENQIFPPQLIPGPLCKAHLSSFVYPYTQS